METANAINTHWENCVSYRYNNPAVLWGRDEFGEERKDVAAPYSTEKEKNLRYRTWTPISSVDKGNGSVLYYLTAEWSSLVYSVLSSLARIYPLDFLTEYLGKYITYWGCQHGMPVTVLDNELLLDHRLTGFVGFSVCIHDGAPASIITDLPNYSVGCRPQGHNMEILEHCILSRMNWVWEHTAWL